MFDSAPTLTGADAHAPDHATRELLLYAAAMLWNRKGGTTDGTSYSFAGRYVRMPRAGRRQGLAALAVTAILATAALAMPRHVDASPAPNAATRGQTSTFGPTGVGAPAIAVASNGTQLVFWGTGGHLFESWYDGSWNGPVDWTAANGWPASVSSTPSVALAADGTQIIFWQAGGGFGHVGGGHLDEVWWNGHWNGPVDWTAANSWPASLNSAPSAALAADGTQIIFWQGAGGHLDEAWWNGSWNGPVDWTVANGWPPLMGSSPSAALDPQGTQIIFWQAPGGHLDEVWWNGHWNGPVDWTVANGWSAPLASAPSVTFTPDGTQLIFWRGANSHLDEVWWNGQWNGPVDVTGSFLGGNGLLTSAPSVALTPDAQQLVFWQGGSQSLWEAWFNSQWNGPADYTPPPPPPPPPPTLCGAPPNPWNYNFCGGGTISSPPTNFCSYFNCIPSFWQFTNGYVEECVDTMYSHSGGVSGSCSSHGGNLRPLNP